VLKGLFHLPIQEFGERVGLPRGTVPSVLHVEQVENLEIIRSLFRLHMGGGVAPRTVDNNFRAFKLRHVRFTLLPDACPEEAADVLKHFDAHYTTLFKSLTRAQMEDHCLKVLFA
jgi:hypothetical protein